MKDLHTVLRSNHHSFSSVTWRDASPLSGLNAVFNVGIVCEESHSGVIPMNQDPLLQPTGQGHEHIFHGIASVIVFVHSAFGNIPAQQLLGTQFRPPAAHEFPK
jgi:hypothetical protein